LLLLSIGERVSLGLDPLIDLGRAASTLVSASAIKGVSFAFGDRVTFSCVAKRK